jgi:hypothetical protein
METRMKILGILFLVLNGLVALAIRLGVRRERNRQLTKSAEAQADITEAVAIVHDGADLRASLRGENPDNGDS